MNVALVPARGDEGNFRASLARIGRAVTPACRLSFADGRVVQNALDHCRRDGRVAGEGSSQQLNARLEINRRG